MQAKLVSSMEDLAPLATGLEDGEKPKLGQELLHNVGLMVGLAETEIQVSGRACTVTARRNGVGPNVWDGFLVDVPFFFIRHTHVQEQYLNLAYRVIGIVYF